MEIFGHMEVFALACGYQNEHSSNGILLEKDLRWETIGIHKHFGLEVTRRV